MKKKADGRLKVRGDVVLWLKRNGLTQTEMAARLGVSVISIQNWIRRGIEPSHMAIAAMRDKYPGCPLLKDCR